MRIDILTAYCVSTLFLTVLTVIVGILYKFIRPATVLRSWLFAMVWYLLIPVGVAVQGFAPLTGICIVNVCTAIHLVYVFRISCIWNRERIPTAALFPGAAVFAAGLPLLAFFSVSFSARACIASFFMGGIYLWAALRIRRIEPSYHLPSSYEYFYNGLILKIAIFCNALIWFIRLGLLFLPQSGESMMDSTPANILMVIGIPALSQLITLTVVGRAIAVKIQEGKSMRSSFLEAGGAEVQRKLLANLNHEINTPLGNALLISEYLSSRLVEDPSLREGVVTLDRSLHEMNAIARDRAVFWDPHNQKMASYLFGQLLERMVRRSMSGFRCGIQFSFGSVSVIHCAHEVLMISLYSCDLMLNNFEDRCGGLLSFAFFESDGCFRFEISDGSPSFLAVSCSSYNPAERLGAQLVLNPDLWPKLLFIDNEVRTALSGTFRVLRTSEDTNCFSISYSDFSSAR